MAVWGRDTPWRQGHLLPEEARQTFELNHQDYRDQTVIVVVSHDCDLTQSVQTEPTVEVIVGRWVEKPEGNFTNAKTARTIHVPFLGDGEDARWAEFKAPNKIGVSKEKLADFRPVESPRLDTASKESFQRWLAARYRRPAFPNEFERRLKEECKLAEKVAKSVQPHGDLIVAVLFDVDEGAALERNGPGDVYELDIVLLYVSGVELAEKAKRAADDAATAIEAAFSDKLFDQEKDSWSWIRLRSVDSVSTQGLTYEQFSLLQTWRLDHISLGADPQQPLPAE